MKRTVAGLAGLFMVGVGLYGFIQSPGFNLNGYTGLHNVYHLVTGLLMFWFVYKNTNVVLISKIFGVFFFATIFESYMGHHMVLEIHGWFHIIISAVLLMIGFVPAGKVGISTKN
jgi:hypothetical protein